MATNEFFAEGYLFINKDVAAAGMDAWTHYSLYGKNEGRGNGMNPPANVFNAAGYLAANKDVAAAGMDPWVHYVLYGYKEGRGNGVSAETTSTPSEAFFAEGYLLLNKDVAAAGMDAWEHYSKYGKAEGRGNGMNPPASVFFAEGYLFLNKDVAAAGMDAWEHYAKYGYKEGRGNGLNPSADIFDAAGYLAANKDVAAAGMDAWEHYVKYGYKEGRCNGVGYAEVEVMDAPAAMNVAPVIPETNANSVKSTVIETVINGTENNDVIAVEAIAGENIRVIGGAGKDTYNVAWNTGANVVIDNTDNNVVSETLNITGLDFADVELYLHGKYGDTLEIADKNGGSITIEGWTEDMITYFNGKGYHGSYFYDSLWHVYEPTALKGSINIIDKNIVNYASDVDRSFTISTDTLGYGQVIVNMTNVEANYSYEYNQTATNFGIVLTNGSHTASIDFENLAASGIEALNIGTYKAFFFAKAGASDYTNAALLAENEVVLSDVKNTWTVKANAGTTVNFSNLQLADANVIGTNSSGNLTNVSNVNGIEGAMNGNDLVLSYVDTYKSAARTLGTVTLVNFSNNAGQMVHVTRNNSSSEHEDLAVAVGTAGADRVTLAADTMYIAGNGNDNVTANTGDYVVGGAGNDTITSKGNYVDAFGGAGNDTIVIGSASSTVEYNMADGGEGNDTINVYGTHNAVRAGAGDDSISITGSYNTAYAGADVDEIKVNGSYNYIYAEAGNDIVTVTSGNYNYVYGGEDNDSIEIAAGSNNNINGENGDDYMVISGGTNNKANGGNGNDTMEITSGTSNKLNGNAGDDYLVVSGGNKNYAYGDAGNDYIEISGGESNYAYGRADNDTIVISGGNKNYAYGDAGDDVIVVTGGTNHTVSGGKGSDTYQVHWSLGNNLTINNSDYTAGDVDSLWITGVSTGQMTVSYSESKGSLELTDTSGGTVKINGWSTNAMDIHIGSEILSASAINSMVSSLTTASLEFAATSVANVDETTNTNNANEVNYVYCN